MPQHWVLNVVALSILTSQFFFSCNSNAATLDCECRSIHASAKIQISSSCLNAVALGNECCGIGVSAKMNAVTFMLECRGIEPFFCIPLVFNFSTQFLLISWPEQTYKLQDEEK